MADPKKSPEIVTEQELKPVLENKTFDSTTFLRLYNEWKVTKDSRLFASLRKMHEDAGYNNKNIVFGADEEMHEIAAIVQKYQDGKTQIAQNTVNATAATSATVASKSKEEVKAFVDEAFDSIDMKDIAKMKQGLDKLKLALDIPRLSPSEKDAILGYTGKMLIARIEQAGYKVYFSSDKKVLVEPVTSTADRSIPTAISAMLNQNPETIQSIATGLLYNSSQFPNFVAINTSEIDGKKGVQKTDADYFKYLREATQSSKRTTSDEALIRSTSAVSAILGLNSDKMKSLMTGYADTGDWIKNNPAITQKITQAVTSQVASSANTPVGTPKQSSSSHPSTWKENPIGKLFGEAGTSVMNGIGNLMSEPGALTGVIVTFIATWIFADFKTALGVLGVATGASAAYDAYKRNKDGDNTQSAPAQNPAAVPQSAPKKLQEMDHAIDVSKKSPAEQKMWNHVKTTPKLLKDLNARQEKLSDYMKFIYDNNLLNKKVSELVLTNNPKDSIFSDTAVMPEGFPKTNLSILEIKRIIRLLLGQDYTYPSNDPDGNTAKSNFIPSKFLKDNTDKKISEEEWKSKKLSDIIPLISKQF